MLNAISEGNLSIKALYPAKVYVFKELQEPRRYSDMNNKEYSIEEYKIFCNEINIINNQIEKITPGGEKNKIITLLFVEGKTIL